MVLKMDDVDEELINQIQNKLIQGPKNSDELLQNKILAKINLALNVIGKSGSLYRIESLFHF